jgi:hypothetical protein
MIFDTLASSSNKQNGWVMLDSTLIRAHQHAAGARKNIATGKQAQELGRGFTTKLHASYDASGKPLRFFITAGQRSDYTKALALIEGKHMSVLIADKGYDVNYMVEAGKKLVLR